MQPSTNTMPIGTEPRLLEGVQGTLTQVTEPALPH
ncbi:hypothetical protein STVIR_8081 [Streptomyces viridochromogenes Tue57]|uniref:Uncharacterized protein n=1 Tax=Streptomyces viridochromogenes Tue57 TaxID=1160705 RepID=L8P6M1_STRVR|nr:hypothetical protein STVIR_8081 [Streptomyces viridochromogenes Tue57]